MLCHGEQQHQLAPLGLLSTHRYAHGDCDRKVHLRYKKFFLAPALLLPQLEAALFGEQCSKG